MPEHFKRIVTYYSPKLDEELMDLCGVAQALRFWKSFPHQAEFVDSQRVFSPLEASIYVDIHPALKDEEPKIHQDRS